MNISAWMPLLVAGLVVLIGALVHLVRYPSPYMPRWAWALLMVFTIPVGALIYIAVAVFDAGTHNEDAEGRATE